MKRLHAGHNPVDSDCLLARLLEESELDTADGRDLASALGRLPVDRDLLRRRLDQIRPGSRGRLDRPRKTGRLSLTEGRARDEALRLAGAEPRNEPVQVEAIHLFFAVLSEDFGPAADALRSAGLPPERARRLLDLPNPRAVHVHPGLWPPPHYLREFATPMEIDRALRRGDPLPAIPHTSPPKPSTDVGANSFVWTAEGSELELWADPNGPIHLLVRSFHTEASVEISAETAEILAGYLMQFYRQVQAERWEPILDAEVRAERKPRPS